MNMGLRFYDVSRYSQPRPHCAFSWLLDKLRQAQAIVTAVSHFLVLDRVRILRIGQHTPNKNFQEYPPRYLKPGSKLPRQHPLANYALCISQFQRLPATPPTPPPPLVSPGDGAFANLALPGGRAQLELTDALSDVLTICDHFNTIILD